MKKFNVSIQIEVQVDAIAQQLLNMFKEDVTYRESVVENIIGVHLNEKRIGHLYNALNGVLPELLEVGTIVYKRVYGRKLIPSTEEGTPPSVGSSEYFVSVAEIVGVDPYATKPYLVSWMAVQRDGTVKAEEDTASATELATSPELIKS